MLFQMYLNFLFNNAQFGFIFKVLQKKFLEILDIFKRFIKESKLFKKILFKTYLSINKCFFNLVLLIKLTNLNINK